MISDVVAIIGSIDPIMGEADKKNQNSEYRIKNTE
jgi:hypothetical protein